MKLAWVLSAALLAFVSILSPVHAQCGARVRKDWDAMTTAEKDTYKGALAAAMDSGAYIKFIEMHTEMQSEMEAHRQCMFIYWHRLLLVVFENMLRGQGPQYACVTVPYYNWVGANNRMLAGSCSSLGDCSTITRELGGYTTGSQRTININGINNSGRCVAQSPLDHFCQSGTVSGSACARCVPRGNWGSASVPSSTSFASVRQQVFNAQNIGQMSPNVEQGCHNNIHANLGGAMGTFASPSEPIFWSHHAMVDALHTIFHKCRVGTQRLTFAQKAAHPVAWTSCAKRGGGSFNPTDVIVMRTGVNGNNPIQGSQDPLIGRYFTGVPNQFAGLMDVRDLGDSSYSYELSGQLADMYNNCDGTPTPAPTTAPAPVTPTAAPTPVTTAPVPVNNAPVTPTAAPQQPGRWGLFDWLRNRWGFGRFGRRLEAEHGYGCGRKLKAEHGWGWWPWRNNQGNNIRGNDCDDEPSVNNNYAPTVPASTAPTNNYAPAVTTPTNNYTPVTIAPTVAPTTAPTTSPQYDGNNNNVDVVTVNKETADEKKVSTWYKKTMANMGGQCAEAMADLERQVCMFENQCLGGTKDYSAAFKATWGAKEPRCLTIVNSIKSGQQKITYGNWRKDMESYFGCPKPTNATQSTKQNAYSDTTQSVVQDATQTATQTATDALSSVVQSV
ncbi:Common central domain of tyrosinase [Phytophthora infestans]|uniref:Common central domain of tyrosinase n=1 Tax=Phytophthora infestans TaxID=4787 RepID=A0A8S9V4C1_PHYIN|nr:Common central domain of tyrosinase [Phytophthora infestans]